MTEREAERIRDVLYEIVQAIRGQPDADNLRNIDEMIRRYIVTDREWEEKKNWTSP